jgi:hypothetical protein
MAEHEVDVTSKVRATETWKEWGRRYQRQLKGLGKEPFKAAEAHLIAIPPDTYDSLMHDLHEGSDTLPFSKIVEELSLEQIEAILEHYSAFGNVAVMQFFKKS